MPSLPPDNSKPYSIYDNFRNYFPQLIAYDLDRQRESGDNESYLQSIFSTLKFYITLIMWSMFLYCWEYVLLYLRFNKHEIYQSQHLYYVYCVGIMIIQCLFISVFSHMSFTLILKGIFINNNNDKRITDSNAKKKSQCIIFTVSIIINIIIGGIIYILIIITKILKHKDSETFFHTISINQIMTNNTNSILCTGYMNCSIIPIMSKLLTFITYPFGFGFISIFVVHILLLVFWKKYNDKPKKIASNKQELEIPLIVSQTEDNNDNVNDIIIPNESIMQNNKKSFESIEISSSKTIPTSTTIFSSKYSTSRTETKQERMQRKIQEKKEKRRKELKNKFPHIYGDDKEKKRIEKAEKIKNRSFQSVILLSLFWYFVLFVSFTITSIIMILLTNISPNGWFLKTIYPIFYYFVLLFISILSQWILKYIGRKIDILRVWMFLKTNKRESISRPMLSVEISMELISSCIYWFGFRYLIMIHIITHKLIVYIIIVFIHLFRISYNGYIKMTSLYFTNILEKLTSDDSTKKQWKIRLSVDIMIDLLICLYSGIHQTVKILCYGRNIIDQKIITNDTNIEQEDDTINTIWIRINLFNIITFAIEIVFFCILLSFHWFKNEWNIQKHIDIQYRARRYSFIILFVVTVIWVQFFF